MTQNPETIPQFRIKHEFFKNLFFSSTIHELNNLDQNIRNSENINIFNNNVWKFIRTKPNSIFDCHNLKGIKLTTGLRRDLSHPGKHYFKNSFQDCLKGRLTEKMKKIYIFKHQK